MGKIKKRGPRRQCRCCLEEIDLKDLWTEYFNDDEREVYGEMLNECFGLPWEQRFEETEFICDNCVVRLRDAVSFKKEILKSDQILKENFKNEASKNVKEEEESDAEIETEYLSIEYLEDEDNEKAKNIVEIKVERETSNEPDVKQESTIQPKSGRRYTEDDFKKCIEAVKSGKLSQTKASIVYRVPRTTIRQALASRGEVKVKLPAKDTNSFKAIKEERNKHLDNITTILQNTNATPIRCERDSRYGCCFCAEFYREPAELKKHNITKHQRVSDTIMRGKKLSDYIVKLDITGLKCNLCTLHVTDLTEMMEHLKSHKKTIHVDIDNHIVPFIFENDELKCAICKIDFNTFRRVFLHMHSHYRNHVCDVCAAGFINEKSFVVHYRIHKKGVFPCAFCKKEFDTYSRKKTHESGVHTNSLRCKCSYCGERFTNSSKKMKHISSVHNVRVRDVKCKICGKGCSSMESLRVHTKRDHLMERKYECQYCNNKYFRLNELKNHLITHTGNKQYPCAICNKYFGRKYELRNHNRLHDEGKVLKR